MAYSPRADERFSPFIASESSEENLAELPAGWEAAQHLQRLRKTLAPGRALQRITESAIDAVLQRARSLLRHASRPTRAVVDAWPAEGELDVDATLEQPPSHKNRRFPYDPKDIVVNRREPRDADVCAILDMSLSMTGEKVALTAVAVAILHMKLDRVGVVAFDTNAHRVVPIGSDLPIREVIRRVLTVPTHGYTHISAGLEMGLDELQRSRRRERVGLLLSDGVANVGWDPVNVARRFPCLHVVQMGRDLPAGTRACRNLAVAGRGRRFHAPTYLALPTVIKRVIRELFRV